LIKSVITVLAVACIGLTAGCTAPKEIKEIDNTKQVIEVTTNKQITIEKAKPIENTDLIDKNTAAVKENVISVQEAEGIIEYIFRRPDIGVSVFDDEQSDIVLNGVKYYYFDILYGLNMIKSPKLEADAVTSAFINSRDKSVYRAVRGKDDKWEIGDRIGEPLQENDLEVVYMDSVIKLGMSTKYVLDKIGNGSASEENNYGFVGWSDDNQYKYYYHEYDGVSIHTKVNVIDGASVIGQINLNSIPTKRGTKIGSTYRMLLLVYGAPAYSDQRDGRTYSVYEYNGSTISFGMGEEKFIDEISMIYKSQQKENNPDSPASEKDIDEVNSINKCKDIAASILGIKDWRTLNATDYHDGENLYISFDGKSDDGKYIIGVRRTKDTTARWWYYFDPVAFDYEIKQ